MVGSVFGAAALIVVAMSVVGYVWAQRVATQMPAGTAPRKIRSRFAQASIQTQGAQK